MVNEIPQAVAQKEIAFLQTGKTDYWTEMAKKDEFAALYRSRIIAQQEGRQSPLENYPDVLRTNEALLRAAATIPERELTDYEKQQQTQKQVNALVAQGMTPSVAASVNYLVTEKGLSQSEAVIAVEQQMQQMQQATVAQPKTQTLQSIDYITKTFVNPKTNESVTIRNTPAFIEEYAKPKGLVETEPVSTIQKKVVLTNRQAAIQSLQSAGYSFDQAVSIANKSTVAQLKNSAQSSMVTPTISLAEKKAPITEERFERARIAENIANYIVRNNIPIKYNYIGGTEFAGTFSAVSGEIGVNKKYLDDRRRIMAHETAHALQAFGYLPYGKDGEAEAKLFAEYYLNPFSFKTKYPEKFALYEQVLQTTGNISKGQVSVSQVSKMGVVPETTSIKTLMPRVSSYDEFKQARELIAGGVAPTTAVKIVSGKLKPTQGEQGDYASFLVSNVLAVKAQTELGKIAVSVQQKIKGTTDLLQLAAQSQLERSVSVLQSKAQTDLDSKVSILEQKYQAQVDSGKLSVEQANSLLQSETNAVSKQVTDKLEKDATALSEKANADLDKQTEMVFGKSSVELEKARLEIEKKYSGTIGLPTTTFILPEKSLLAPDVKRMFFPSYKTPSITEFGLSSGIFALESILTPIAITQNFLTLGTRAMAAPLLAPVSMGLGGEALTEKQFKEALKKEWESGLTKKFYETKYSELGLGQAVSAGIELAPMVAGFGLVGGVKAGAELLGYGLVGRGAGVAAAKVFGEKATFRFGIGETTLFETRLAPLVETTAFLIAPAAKFAIQKAVTPKILRVTEYPTAIERISKEGAETFKGLGVKKTVVDQSRLFGLWKEQKVYRSVFEIESKAATKGLTADLFGARYGGFGAYPKPKIEGFQALGEGMPRLYLAEKVGMAKPVTETGLVSFGETGLKEYLGFGGAKAGEKVFGGLPSTGIKGQKYVSTVLGKTTATTKGALFVFPKIQVLPEVREYSGLESLLKSYSIPIGKKGEQFGSLLVSNIEREQQAMVSGLNIQYAKGQAIGTEFFGKKVSGVQIPFEQYGFTTKGGLEFVVSKTLAGKEGIIVFAKKAQPFDFWGTTKIGRKAIEGTPTWVSGTTQGTIEGALRMLGLETKTKLPSVMQGLDLSAYLKPVSLPVSAKGAVQSAVNLSQRQVQQLLEKTTSTQSINSLIGTEASALSGATKSFLESNVKSGFGGATVQKTRTGAATVLLPRTELKPLVQTKPKIDVGFKLIDNIKIELKEKAKISEREWQNIFVGTKAKTISETKAGTKFKPIVLTGTLSGILEAEAQKTDVAMKAITATATAQAIATRTALKELEITITGTKLKPFELDIKPPKPRIGIPQFSLEDTARMIDKKNKEESGYVVMAKQKGEFVVLNKKALRYTDALNYGGAAVDESAAKTFKIVPTRKPIEAEFKRYDFDVLKYKFRQGKQPNSFIEQNKYGIDTVGELKQITVKGWAARKENALVARRSRAEKKRLAARTGFWL